MALFGFPNPVDERAARVVAGGVLTLAATTLVLSLAVSTDWLWLLVPLVYGFAARVASGPRFSPLGLLATRVVAPRLGAPRPTPGPPKRFAQLVGLTVTAAALVLAAAGAAGVADALLGVLVVAAGLESLAGYCLGCRAFAVLMRVGVIPREVCAECADVSARLRAG